LILWAYEKGFRLDFKITNLFLKTTTESVLKKIPKIDFTLLLWKDVWPGNKKKVKQITDENNKFDAWCYLNTKSIDCDTFFNFFKHFTNLTSIGFDASELTESNLLLICENNQNLTHIELRDNDCTHQISGDCIAKIIVICKLLNSLEVSLSKSPLNQIVYEAILSSKFQFIVLGLSYSEVNTFDKYLPLIVSHCDNLSKLYLRHCPSLNNHILAYICSNLKLQTLDISYNNVITNAGIVCVTNCQTLEVFISNHLFFVRKDAYIEIVKKLKKLDWIEFANKCCFIDVWEIISYFKQVRYVNFRTNIIKGQINDIVYNDDIELPKFKYKYLAYGINTCAFAECSSSDLFVPLSKECFDDDKSKLINVTDIMYCGNTKDLSGNFNAYLVKLILQNYSLRSIVSSSFSQCYSQNICYALAASCHNLLRVNFDKSDIDNVCLMVLTHKCKLLTDVSLYKCKAVTNVGLEFILYNLQNLHKLCIHQTGIVPEKLWDMYNKEIPQNENQVHTNPYTMWW
jgi:hypothetical protein